MRLLLDTNVLVAALATRGVCAELFLHCVRRHALFTSPFIRKEFRRTGVSKLGYAAVEAEDLAEFLFQKMTMVSPSPLSRPVCRDRQDDAVLGAALAGTCKALITGDKDLLVLGNFQTVRILSPSGFWKYEAQLEE